MFEQTPRTRRVSEAIRRELAQPLQMLCRDEQLGIVSVTLVEVSPDLRHARIHITVLGDDDAVVKALEVLNEAAGSFRHHLAHEIPTKTIPRLKFVYDESIERGARLSKLIDELNSDQPKSQDQDTP